MAFVLILDHDTDAAQRIALWLRERRHEARDCGWPHQALRHARLHRFDMAWMAWPLVGMEVLEMLRRLRQIRPLLPVVVISQAEMPIELNQQLKARGVRMILRGYPGRHVVLAVTDVVCALSGARR